MRIDESVMLNSNVPMYEIPIIRSSLNGVQKYVQTVFEVCKFKRQAVFGTIFLSYFESINPKKTCIFQGRTGKVPIEEMTDRWETEYSDG